MIECTPAVTREMTKRGRCLQELNKKSECGDCTRASMVKNVMCARVGLFRDVNAEVLLLHSTEKEVGGAHVSCPAFCAHYDNVDRYIFRYA